MLNSLQVTFPKLSCWGAICLNIKREDKGFRIFDGGEGYHISMNCVCTMSKGYHDRMK